MDGITLSFTDARPVLAPGALEEQVRAAAPLLAEAAAGEERYRDNLGWHSVDEAAGPERVDFLLEQAARVRADATPSWSSESAAPTRRPGPPSRPCGRRGAPPSVGGQAPSPPARWPALCGSWTDYQCQSTSDCIGQEL